MAANAKGRTILDLLLEKQILTAEQAEKVSKLQAETGSSTEQTLIDLGMLTEDDLAVFMSDALQVRFLKLEDVEIDREAVKHVPAAVAHAHKLIPLRRSGNALAVVFADPTDAEAMTALRNVTDFEIIPFVGRKDVVEHALYLHYGEPRQTMETPVASPASAARPQSLMEDDRISYMGKSVQLNRRWVFDLFVQDGASQFPLSVAKAVADFQSDAGYNPFSCWGPSGCGKSHLLHAIANYVAAHSPLKRFILTTGERFCENLFEAIRDQKLNLFRYLYRESDMLMIDDADALTNRDWAQAELVETFLALQKSGKQLVLASRGNLALNPVVAPKLKEIVETGVIAGFTEYSTEAKLQMIKLQKGGVELAPEMLTYLVRRCGDSVADLMTLLQQITVLALRGEQEISHSVVDDLIRLCGLEAGENRVDSSKSKAKPATRPAAAAK